MRCPRCDEELETFTAEATGRSAVVCEACGYTGISASHHSEAEDDAESWEQALARSDGSGVPPARTARAEAVSTPDEDSS